MSSNHFDIIDLLIKIGVLGFIGTWCFILLRPFILLMLWATILAVALYPIFDGLKDRLGGRKNLSATLIALVCMGIIIGPVAFLITTLIDNVNTLITKILSGSLTLPPPPDFIETLPFVGTSIDNVWELASVNILDALNQLEPQIKQLATYLFPITANASLGVLQFLVSIVISAFLMINAKSLGKKITRFITRITPDKGEAFIILASSTLRNIVRGVIGIAVIQTIIVAIGLFSVGIPSAGLLTFACLILTIIQIGPGLIVFPSIIFVWMTMNSVVALIYTIWMVFATLIDNFLKPVLMARGLSIPMIIILVGVFGGTLAHGIIGLFIGPVVLALGYELVRVWIDDQKVSMEVEALTQENLEKS